MFILPQAGLVGTVSWGHDALRSRDTVGCQTPLMDFGRFHGGVCGDISGKVAFFEMPALQCLPSFCVGLHQLTRPVIQKM